MLPGCQAPTAPAPSGSPVVVVAMALPVFDAEPNSRRLTAKAVAASGTATGESPLPSALNHANNSPSTSLTSPASAGSGAAISTGVSTAGASVTSATVSANSSTATSAESLTAAMEFTTSDRSGVESLMSELIPASAAALGTAETWR